MEDGAPWRGIVCLATMRAFAGIFPYRVILDGRSLSCRHERQDRWSWVFLRTSPRRNVKWTFKRYLAASLSLSLSLSLCLFVRNVYFRLNIEQETSLVRAKLLVSNVDYRARRERRGRESSRLNWPRYHLAKESRLALPRDRLCLITAPKSARNLHVITIITDEWLNLQKVCVYCCRLGKRGKREIFIVWRASIGPIDRRDLLNRLHFPLAVERLMNVDERWWTVEAREDWYS